MRMARIDFEGHFCVFTNPLDAMEELRTFVEESGGGETMSVEIVEMSMEDFDKLPEFDGW